MKSFSQFLHESYLNEEVPAGMTRDQFNSLPAESRRRLGGSKAALGRQGQPLQGGASAPAIRSARASANAAPEVTTTNDIASRTTQPNVEPKVTKVSSPARKPGDPWNWFPKKRQPQLGLPKEGPSSRIPNKTLTPAGGTTPKEALPPIGSRERGGDLARRTSRNPGIPDAMMQGAQDAANRTNTPRPGKTPKPSNSSSSSTFGVGKETVKASTPQAQPQRSTTSSGRREITPEMEAEIRKIRADRKVARAAAYDAKNSSSALAKRQSSSLTNTGKPSSSAIVPASAGKPPAGVKPSRFGRIAGPASAVLDTALSTADERAKGSGWARSLAKGATVAAGGLLGGTAGAIGGGGLLSAATGTAGAMAGGAAAEKAFDTVAGANAKERKAMATANRQRQAGTALKGIGGKTTFDTKKNTMTTGTGAQRKTVGLAKTGVVQRGGQSVAGHLAYKGGKAVYKAGPSAQSLAKTSSNPLERIGRSLFAGAYKKSDAANAAKKLATARANDAARNKALGVKSKPAG
jgi:hypothetical protein